MKFTKTLVTAELNDEVIKQATEAYQKGDFHTVFKLFQPLAEQGNSKAQYNLGVMYDNGQGVKQDYQQAVYWYQKAAEQGNAKAQYNLGVMYDKGQGVKQELSPSIVLVSKSGREGRCKGSK